MKACFVVQGGTGEYSDRIEWVCGIFLSQDSAESKAKELNQWALVNLVQRKNYHTQMASYESRDKLTEELRKLDPGFAREEYMSIGYNGIDYWVIRSIIEDMD